MGLLDNTTAMVSGGSLGIGYAIAARLGELGANVSVCARRVEPLRDALARFEERGISALGVLADVSREEDVERWFSDTEERFGPAGVLVNNAGVSGYGDLMELTDEAWDQTFSVNCRGVFLCTKRALPAMIEAKKGRILMISSIASQYYRRGHGLYFATKWALNGFSHCLAKEVNPHNIHVHILCPGMVETRFFDSAGGRPHPGDREYAEPSVYADLAETLLRLPENLDTLEWCALPQWQLKNFGIRR